MLHGERDQHGVGDLAVALDAGEDFIRERRDRAILESERVRPATPHPAQQRYRVECRYLVSDCGAIAGDAHKSRFGQGT